jgi:hypothetical protein
MNRIGLITAALTIFSGTAAADTKQTSVDQQPVSAVSPVELRPTLHAGVQQEVRAVRVILPSPYGPEARKSPVFRITR